MNKKPHVQIGTIGHVGYGKTTLTAAIVAVLNQSMSISQHMKEAPFHMLSMHNHDCVYYDDELYDHLHTEIKGKAPSGRSQEQHNAIMSLNKKRKPR